MIKDVQSHSLVCRRRMQLVNSKRRYLPTNYAVLFRYWLNLPTGKQRHVGRMHAIPVKW
jgi:hypothetical protein